ncbi:hypothetical protein MRX96_050069, partial [Rhipicephalus microplus]
MGHSKDLPEEHSNEPTHEYAKTMLKERFEGPGSDTSQGTAKEVSKQPSRKLLKDASKRYPQQALKKPGNDPHDELFKRTFVGPSKATSDIPTRHSASSTRPAAGSPRERTAAQTVTLTGGSESSDSRVGYPSFKETASEVGASSSWSKQRSEKAIAPSKITEKDTAHRPLRETEATRTTNILSGTTSPFTVESAVSPGKRSFEDAATEPENKERKAEPEIKPESGVKSTIDDVREKPKIFAQASFERRVLVPSHL